MSQVIWVRRKTLQLNDPRCYDGAYFDAEYVWGPWEQQDTCRDLKPGKTPQDRLKFWREINDYAVSQRGDSAKCEYELREDTP